MVVNAMNTFCGALNCYGFMEPAWLAVTDAGLGGLTSIRDVGSLGKECVKHLCKVLWDEEIPISIIDHTLEAAKQAICIND
jgi:hypothetical protein